MRYQALAAAGVMAALLSGCGTRSSATHAEDDVTQPTEASTSGKPAPPSPITITGTLLIRTLPDGYGWACGRSFNATDGVGSAGYRNVSRLVNGMSIPCPQGLGGGFSDLQNGTDVTVKDAQGTILGVGHLRGGRFNTMPHARLFGTSFIFRVPKVTQGTAFYQVQVSHRDPLTFPSKKLARKGWEITLIIGN